MRTEEEAVCSYDRSHMAPLMPSSSPTGFDAALKLLHQWVRNVLVLPHIWALLAVRSYSQLMMLLNGGWKEEKKENHALYTSYEVLSPVHSNILIMPFETSDSSWWAWWHLSHSSCYMPVLWNSEHYCLVYQMASDIIWTKTSTLAGKNSTEGSFISNVPAQQLAHLRQESSPKL